MSKPTEVYIRFSIEDVEPIIKALHVLHGYATAKISLNDSIYQEERELMVKCQLLTTTFAPPLETVKKIRDDEIAAKYLKKAFTNELLSILKDNKDPEQFPGQLGELFNKYEIISRKPDDDDNLPF